MNSVFLCELCGLLFKRNEPHVSRLFFEQKAAKNAKAHCQLAPLCNEPGKSVATNENTVLFLHSFFD